MPTALQRSPVPGPTFIRLLARVADADVPAPGPALGERLGQWIDWTRAVALAGALDGRPSPSAPAAPATGPDGDDEVARTRAALAEAIARDLPTPPAAVTDADAIDFAPSRQHCLAMQRAMQAATGRLRGRLRDRLAQRSPELARLAEVDAVMEATLSPREQALLGIVPGLLGQHFQRLRDAGAPDTPADADASAGDTPATPAGPWLARFRQDMRTALLAELEIRFHPIDGLLAALRTR